MSDLQAGGKLRPYFELVRPPALCTAAADSLCAWAWVSQLGSLTLTWLEQAYIVIILIMISACIYAAGMCTNDLFDFEEDQRERPFRPLPSARVSLATAWRLALSLQLLAIVLSILIGYSNGEFSGLPLSFVLATILATYLYNRVFKNTLIAPIFMGLCRFSNFWIGASLLFAFGIDGESLSLCLPLYISMGTMAYVTSLTALSRHEVHGGPKASFWGLTMIFCATHPVWWGILGGFTTNIWIVVLVELLVVGWLFKHILPMIQARGEADMVQRAVGAGIRGVALTHIVLCIGFGSWMIAGLLLSMSLTASKVGRWFYAT